MTRILGAWARCRGILGPGSKGSAGAGGICCPQASMFGLCQHTDKKEDLHDMIGMILHCTHGQEHVHVPQAQVPPSHGAKSRDSSAESAEGSG